MNCSWCKPCQASMCDCGNCNDKKCEICFGEPPRYGVVKTQVRRFSTVVQRTESDLDYDPESGTLTVNKPGSYSWGFEPHVHALEVTEAGFKLRLHWNDEDSEGAGGDR